MKVTLSFAELHAPLFLSGKSHGMKLDLTGYKHQGMKLEYDRDAKELLVTYGDATAIVPISNVATMVEAKDAPKTKEPKGAAGFNTTQTLGSSVTAQVSTPTGHVHAGPGAGKSK